MFLLHGDAKYIDVLERTLYNGLISGVSLDGKTYFYPNPLASNGQHQRSPWFGVACCPGNITRFMPSLPGYVYAEQDGTLFNLFMSNTADIVLRNGRKLKVTQQTGYPWSGDVKISIDPEQAGVFAVRVRIPGWARNEAVSGDLYGFVDGGNAPVKLQVNGAEEPVRLENGICHREPRMAQGRHDQPHLADAGPADSGELQGQCGRGPRRSVAQFLCPTAWFAADSL